MGGSGESAIERERLERYVSDVYADLHHDYLISYRLDKESQGGKEVLQAMIDYFDLNIACWKIEDRVKKELLEEEELLILEEDG